MDFNPSNTIIRLCMQGMAMEERGELAAAGQTFMQAYQQASNKFEKFVAAYYIARHQHNVNDKLNWLRTTLNLAISINNFSVKGALPSIYSDMAKCYNDISETENANHYEQLARSSSARIDDPGPFYHGTKADMQTGDLLTAGYQSNYKDELVMNHIYFTAVIAGAGLAAELARGSAPPRVYIVEPTGDFENDPNVTNKRFPGNPTRSYRTTFPLKVTGETTDWTRLPTEEIEKWKERLNNSTGEIIN